VIVSSVVLLAVLGWAIWKSKYAREVEEAVPVKASASKPQGKKK
jgi:hypothetical protein